MHDGEELVEEPFRRLIGEGKLMTYPHDGYWACMDTFKEKQDLEDVFGRGNAPWAVWNLNADAKEAARDTLQLDSVKRVVCLGAHTDDIEIGCGGTVLRLMRKLEQD